MAGLDGTIVNTALPAIISDLHGLQYMGWIVAIFLLGMAISAPLWSKLGERQGNKFAYIAGTTLFGLGAFFQGIAPNIVWFIIARGVMGIGAGGMNTMPFIIYAQMFRDIKRRAQVIGIATASFNIAAIIGPLAGGALVDAFSWHWVFFLNLPIAILSILLVYFYLNLKEVLNKSAIDYAGAALMIVGLSLILVAIQLLGTVAIWATVILAVIGIAVLIVMAHVEALAIDPIIPTRLFKNLKLVIDFSLFAILWGAFVAFNIYIPMWAQGVLGVSALIGGMTQIPDSITTLIGSEIGPLYQQKIGRYGIVSIGTGAFLISFLGMTLAGNDVSYWFLLLMGAFEGLGLGLCFNVLQVSVQDDTELNDVPIATSFAYLARILSQTFMSSIYGVILNHALNAGVKRTNGQVTMNMLNKLSNAKVVDQLPKSLIPTMRHIMTSGIHNIMLTAVILLVLVVIILVGVYVHLSRHKAGFIE